MSHALVSERLEHVIGALQHRDKHQTLNLCQSMCEFLISVNGNDAVHDIINLLNQNLHKVDENSVIMEDLSDAVDDYASGENSMEGWNAAQEEMKDTMFLGWWVKKCFQDQNIPITDNCPTCGCNGSCNNQIE